MKPEEFYESLQEKKPFTELTSTGISDNLPNVFEFAKMYAEAITVTPCCKSDSELLSCKCGLPKRNQGIGFSCMRTDCDANTTT